MPVVLTDYTNKTWALEDPRDGLLHVGKTGEPGPRLEDVLEFLSNREKQFQNFVTKKRLEEIGKEAKRRGARGRQERNASKEVETPLNES